MEWLLDGFGTRATKIWLIEATGALRTVAAAKVPKGLGRLPIQKCVLEVP